MINFDTKTYVKAEVAAFRRNTETAKEKDIVRGKWECVSCGKIGELKGFFKARYENDHYCMDCVEIVGEE